MMQFWTLGIPQCPVPADVPSRTQLHQLRDGSARSSPSPRSTTSPLQCQRCAAAMLQSLQGNVGGKKPMCLGWWDAHSSRSGSLPGLLCHALLPPSQAQMLPTATSSPGMTFTSCACIGAFTKQCSGCAHLIDRAP